MCRKNRQRFAYCSTGYTLNLFYPDVTHVRKTPGCLPVFRTACDRKLGGNWEAIVGLRCFLRTCSVLFLPITAKTRCSSKHFEQFSNTLTYSHSHVYHVGYVPATSDEAALWLHSSSFPRICQKSTGEYCWVPVVFGCTDSLWERFVGYH